MAQSGGEITERIVYKKDSRFFNRLLFSGAQEIEIDVQAE